MVSYLFRQNVSLNLIPNIDEINFYHHINLFDWPIEHSHRDYWEFTVVTNGTIVNCINGKEKIYKAGMVFVATTSDCHFLKAGNKQVRYITILVKEKFILGVLKSLDLNKEIFGRSGSDPTLSNPKLAEIEELLQHIDYSNSQKYKEHDKLACSVLLELLSAYVSTESFYNLEISPWQQTLNRLAQNEKLLAFNVNDLCKELGYSRTQLNTLFKKSFDLTPHDYLTNYKFMYAKNLLLNTNLSVANIAYKVGFSSTMQFYVNFKNIFGITPAEFRENQN